MKFDFTDKASYLAWRQVWKANYAALSESIRSLKRRRKQYINRYEREVTPQGPSRRLISREPNPHHGDCWGLGELRSQAQFEMERLVEAKALSWQLRNARLAEERIAA